MRLFPHKRNKIKFSDNLTGNVIILHSNGDHTFSWCRKATELVRNYIPGVDKVFTRDGNGTKIEGNVLQAGEMILRFSGPRMVYLNNNQGTGFALLERKGFFG